MGEPSGRGGVPSQNIVREAAFKIFEAESKLHIEPESWQFKSLADKGIAAAKFALASAKGIIFRNVLVLVRYDKSSPYKIHVQASINGLSPMHREFYVAEGFPLPQTEDAKRDRKEKNHSM